MPLKQRPYRPAIGSICCPAAQCSHAWSPFSILLLKARKTDLEWCSLVGDLLLPLQTGNWVSRRFCVYILLKHTSFCGRKTKSFLLVSSSHLVWRHNVWPEFLMFLYHNLNFQHSYPPLVAQMVKNPTAMQETGVRSLGGEGLLEKRMTTHFSILFWGIPGTEEPDRLHSPWGPKRVRHDWATDIFTLLPTTLPVFILLCSSELESAEEQFTFVLRGSLLSWDWSLKPCARSIEQEVKLQKAV